MGTTAFLVASVALGLVVLVFVLRPLWPGSRLLAATLGAAVALSAVALYLVVGAGLLEPRMLVAPQAPASMAEAIVQLEAELQRDPRQPDAWRLLGRAYRAEGRAADSSDAFARAARLLPDDPDALVDAAEARALAAPQRILDAQAVVLLQRALEQQPQHQRARWFLGIARRQAGDPAAAAATWEPLLAKVDAATAASLRPQIDAARAEAGLPPLPPPESADTGVATTITVTLAPALAARLSAGASLFVIARQPGGPPMPVAVRRLAVGAFPVQVALDDSDSPMPTLKLSQLAQVEIVARVSASGDATARPGDLESTPVTVAPGQPVAIAIDRVVE